MDVAAIHYHDWEAAQAPHVHLGWKFPAPCIRGSCGEGLLSAPLSQKIMVAPCLVHETCWNLPLIGSLHELPQLRVRSALNTIHPGMV